MRALQQENVHADRVEPRVIQLIQIVAWHNVCTTPIEHLQYLYNLHPIILTPRN